MYRSPGGSLHEPPTSVWSPHEVADTGEVAHAARDHLTVLGWPQSTGQRAKPGYHDPLADILRERGLRHEEALIRATREAMVRVRG